VLEILKQLLVGANDPTVAKILSQKYGLSDLNERILPHKHLQLVSSKLSQKALLLLEVTALEDSPSYQQLCRYHLTLCINLLIQRVPSMSNLTHPLKNVRLSLCKTLYLLPFQQVVPALVQLFSSELRINKQVAQLVQRVAPRITARSLSQQLLDACVNRLQVPEEKLFCMHILKELVKVTNIDKDLTHLLQDVFHTGGSKDCKALFELFQLIFLKDNQKIPDFLQNFVTPLLENLRVDHEQVSFFDAGNLKVILPALIMRRRPATRWGSATSAASAT